MNKIILASGSAQRKLLMESLGIPFEIIPPDVDEKIIRDKDLKLRAEKLARAKAEKIASKHNAIIIAADTFSACQGKILEKPQSLKDAYNMLKLQSNNTGITYTGFCYIDKKAQIDFSQTVISEYTFRELSNSEINNFIENNPVINWSAAFSPAYPYQLTFIAKLNGSLTGFTHGLPIELLVPLLKKSGIQTAQK